MIRRSMWLTVVLALLAAGAQSAAAATFTFAGTQTRSCWEDTEGFDAFQPKPLPAPLPGGIHFLRFTTSSDSQTFALNTDGTYTSTIVATILRTVGNGQTLVSHSTCNGTWTFDAGPLILHTQGTCAFTDTIGGTSTGTATGLQSDYQLAGTILVRLDPDPPVIEAVHVNQNPPTPAFDYQRVCARSATLIFMK
jgi:hypothetical protein